MEHDITEAEQAYSSASYDMEAFRGFPSIKDMPVQFYKTPKHEYEHVKNRQGKKEDVVLPEPSASMQGLPLIKARLTSLF